MIKYRWEISPTAKKNVVRFCIALSILLGHVFAGFVLIFLQNSVTCKNIETLLLAEIAGVQKNISVANSANEPELMYLFTEYDVVGENGGIIIADGLHDIRCGKRLESCRTLEDAGIDINKYKPMKRSEAVIFGVSCHFAYFKGDDVVIVTYIPVVEQVRWRNMNVFSFLGVSFIFSVLLFFLVPLVIQFFTKPGTTVVPDHESSIDDEAEEIQQDYTAEIHDTDVAETLEDAADTDDLESEYDDYDIVMPEEETLDDISESSEEEDASGQSVADSAEYAVESSADEPDAEKDNEITDLQDYILKMQELKKAAEQLGEEKLFKMADYLEKCGKAVFAGSKDADKFMAEIDSKTPIAINYYAKCVYKNDNEPETEESKPQQTEQSATATQSAVPEPEEEPAEPEQKPDIPKIDAQPAEIFAMLEALYAGASSADKNAVLECMDSLDKINLPRKLNVVFPELSKASANDDFASIKTIIDSLRTGNRSA